MIRMDFDTSSGVLTLDVNGDCVAVDRADLDRLAELLDDLRTHERRLDNWERTPGPRRFAWIDPEDEFDLEGETDF